MRYVCTALLSVATCLLPFSTPAIAELGHPSGCVGCPPVEIGAPTEGSFREGASGVLNVSHDGIGRALADLARTDIHATHARVGREGNKACAQGSEIPFAQLEALLRKHHDAAAFRGLIGE